MTKSSLLVFLLFLGLSVLVTWPLVLHLNTLIIDRYDSLLITWIINWVITHGPNLSANIFYPYRNTLAFSDFHLASAVIAAPFVWLFKEPLLAFNVNVIAGLTFTGFSGYLLARHLTHNEPVSIFTGILLAFSTLHLNYLAHLQLFHLWLVILPLLFLLQKRRRLFTLFFVLAALNSPLNFYFLLFFAVIFRALRFSLPALLLTAPLLLPYWVVSRQFNYARTITDAIHFSLQFPDLANVSIYSRLTSFITQEPGTPAYFGGVFLVLLLLVIGKLKSSPWVLGALGSFVLALGPALHVFRDTVHLGPIPAIPLPYAIFYYLLPGFSGFRTPSRWILITFLCLAIVIAIHFAKKINWKWAIILSILILAEVIFPFRYYSVPPPPPEQIWLKNNYSGAPIIQFPIYGWFDGVNVGVETLRMYYSTIHWHPMFNGYSGFSPNEWEDRVRWLQKKFPDGETVGFLRNLGIKLVLVPSDWDMTPVQNELELVAPFPATKIYALDGRFKN